MKDLQESRKNIAEIDKKMAELFAARMREAADIAAYKKEAGLPIRDKAREEQLIAENSRLVTDEATRAYYVSFMENVMLLSRRYQQRLLEGMRVAYSGVPGAFSDAACRRIFPYAASVAYKDFAAAYAAVENGECDCAVLPLENSFAGDVTQVMDLAFFGSLSVNGIYAMEIVQNLLAVKGAKLADIREVISHPQALSQCSAWLKEHNEIAVREAANTALAAQEVAQSGSKELAAIANEETAALYGLDILEKRINTGNINTTRFAVFSRSAEHKSDDDYFLLTFMVHDEVGSLSRTLEVISRAGFNLRSLKSRPTRDAVWEYYFFAEGEGNIHSPKGQQMLSDLQDMCHNIRVIGSFPAKSMPKL